MGVGSGMFGKVLCLCLAVQLSSCCNQNFIQGFLNGLTGGSSPSPSPSPVPSPSPAPSPTPVPTPAPTPSGSCTCGKANRRTKIVGGVATEENEYPWQVGLLSSEWSSQPFCGGTLISDKDVLTAAHCTSGSTSAAYVVLGEHNLGVNDGEKKVRVCSVKNHPNYNDRTVDYDFAILTLCESVSFTSDISPACLPSSSSNNYDNRESVVSGWGTLSTGGSTPNVLHEVTVNTMSNSQCRGSSTDYSSSDITDRMLRAGAGGKDACQGDSGGPLVTKESTNFYTVIGVVSWGFGCADARAPGVYARVTNQLSWIKSNSEGDYCAPVGR